MTKPPKRIKVMRSELGSLFKGLGGKGRASHNEPATRLSTSGVRKWEQSRVCGH